MPTLQAGVQFQDLGQDQAFISAPEPEQVQYLMEDYLPKNDPEFAKAPQAEKLQYIQQSVLPQIKAIQPLPVKPQGNIVQQALRPIQKGLTAASLFAGSVGDPFADAMTLGYGDSKARAEQQAKMLYPNIEQDQGLLGNAYRLHQNGLLNSVGQMAGMVNPVSGLENLSANLTRGLAQKVLPGGTSIAKTVGQAVPWQQLATGALNTGLGLGAYEGLKSRPNQMDIPGRIQDAASGFVSGAALPYAAAGAGKVLKGGIKAVRNIGRTESAQIGFASAARKAKENLKQQAVEAFHTLANTLRDIQEGRIDHTLVNPHDYARLAVKMEQLGKSITEGKIPKNPNQALRIARKIQGKASIQAKRAGRAIGKQAEVVAEAKAENTGPPEKKKAVKLTGTVKEMVEQAVKESGMTLDEPRTLVGHVKTLGKAEDHPDIKKLTEQRKELGSKRDDATKSAKADIDAKIAAVKAERKATREKAGTINANLREVLGTNWDGKSPLADQDAIAPEQLKGEAVASHITDSQKAVFEKVDSALKAGTSIRVEHQAEITGSTDAAAKITSAGKVKVPVSTFTPTHYSVTEKSLNGVKGQYVAVHGYNEAGHMSKYYITKTPEGSQILKVQKILPNEAFVGVTPNVELGVRKYKVADVLGRTPREEGVLTSEALSAAKSFTEIYKPENLQQFSKNTQFELKRFRKHGKFDQKSFERLHNQMKKNPEDMKAFCRLFGLV